MRLQGPLMAVLFVASSGSAWAQAGERLRRLDADGDGAISRAEAAAARTVFFDRLDADRDGVLSAEERNAASGRGGLSRLLSSTDANGDGRTTRAELMAAPYPAFDRLDTDADDVISAEELAVAGAATR